MVTGAVGGAVVPGAMAGVAIHSGATFERQGAAAVVGVTGTGDDDDGSCASAGVEENGIGEGERRGWYPTVAKPIFEARLGDRDGRCIVSGRLDAAE